MEGCHHCHRDPPLIIMVVTENMKTKMTAIKDDHHEESLKKIRCWQYLGTGSCASILRLQPTTFHRRMSPGHHHLHHHNRITSSSSQFILFSSSSYSLSQFTITMIIRFRGFTVTKAVCGGCHTMVLGVPIPDFQVGDHNFRQKWAKFDIF